MRAAHGEEAMTAPAVCKIPLTLEAQPDGGFTITSPLLPELVTEGDSLGIEWSAFVAA